MGAQLGCRVSCMRYVRNLTRFEVLSAFGELVLVLAWSGGILATSEPDKLERFIRRHEDYKNFHENIEKAIPRNFGTKRVR